MSTHASVIVILLVGSMVFPPSSLPQAESVPPVDAQTPLLRARSELVVLHVAVQDRRSQFVTGLAASQFKVYEDGVLQTIQVFSHEDRPATIGLVIDNSGSMRNKRDDVIAASLAFIRASNPENELFITNFNEEVWPGLPEHVPFTRNPALLALALSGTLARGRTALYDAVTLALEHVRSSENTRQVLIIISDGRDNASVGRLQDVLQRAQAAHAVIYTLGLFDELSYDRDPGVLKHLSAATGGDRFLPRSAREASAILERIARDIRNTYDIGYESTNPRHDGKFRRVDVKVESARRNRWSVRARTGYVVPVDPQLSMER